MFEMTPEAETQLHELFQKSEQFLFDKHNTLWTGATVPDRLIATSGHLLKELAATRASHCQTLFALMRLGGKLEIDDNWGGLTGFSVNQNIRYGISYRPEDGTVLIHQQA